MAAAVRSHGEATLEELRARILGLSDANMATLLGVFGGGGARAQGAPHHSRGKAPTSRPDTGKGRSSVQQECESQTPCHALALKGVWVAEQARPVNIVRADDFDLEALLDAVSGLSHAQQARLAAMVVNTEKVSRAAHYRQGACSPHATLSSHARACMRCLPCSRPCTWWRRRWTTRPSRTPWTAHSRCGPSCSHARTPQGQEPHPLLCPARNPQGTQAGVPSHSHHWLSGCARNCCRGCTRRQAERCTSPGSR